MDGFDDGSSIADEAGRFQFADVRLVDGANVVRVQIGSGAEVQTATQRIVVDRVAPRATGWSVGDGTAQRSVIRQVGVNFDETVYAVSNRSGLILTNVGTGSKVDPASMVLVGDGSTAWSWRFSGLTGGTLVDGNYTAVIDVTEITDAAGNRVVLNAGASVSFHRYFGDADGDRDVDFLDTFRYRQTLNRTSAEAGFDGRFDADGNGAVDALDASLFQSHYLTRLDAPTVPFVPPARPTPAVTGAATTRPSSGPGSKPSTDTRSTSATSVVISNSTRGELQGSVTLPASVRSPSAPTLLQLDLLVQLRGISAQRNGAVDLLEGLSGADGESDFGKKSQRAHIALRRLAPIRSSLP